VTFDTSIL